MSVRTSTVRISRGSFDSGLSSTPKSEERQVKRERLLRIASIYAKASERFNDNDDDEDEAPRPVAKKSKSKAREFTAAPSSAANISDDDTGGTPTLLYLVANS